MHLDFAMPYGVYRIRFMPDVQGTWRYRTQSTLDALNGVEGTFTCVAPAPHNHGPVCVFPKHYLSNENEPPLYPFPCLSRGSSRWDFDQFVREEASLGWSFDFERFDQHLARAVQKACRR